VPQAPQFSRSLRVSAQRRNTPPSPLGAPPHWLRGAAHRSAHAPSEHTCPVGHSAAHAPQLNESLLIDTQRPAHTVCPAGHEVRQALATQTCPVAHVRPHAPQLERSMAMSTQRPSQRVWSAGHAPTGTSTAVSITVSSAASPTAGTEPSQPTAANIATTAHASCRPGASLDARNHLLMEASFETTG
jgi:hypothetical protein